MKKVIVELLVDEERLGSVNGYEDMDLHDALNSELEVMRENGVQALDWRVVKDKFKLADIFKDDTLARCIPFNFHEDGERIIKMAHDIICRYGCVTVADLYDLNNMDSSWKDQKFGWQNVTDWEILETWDGYYLRTTEPRPIDELERPAGVIRRPKLNPWDKHKNDKTVHKFDNVNHPSHYQTSKGFETIDVMTEYTKGMDNVEAINTAQIIKYICRWNRKNGIEDLNKAKWYLNKLIKYKEGENADD